MIVDDNAMMQSTVKEYLQRHGNEAQFIECEDGDDAVVAYSGNNPDLVCMDIRMPRMDGIMATTEIMRANPAARVETDWQARKRRCGRDNPNACPCMITNGDNPDLRGAVGSEDVPGA